MVKADFDQVYEENKIRVWKLVSRYVFTREDREDLFQEIFLKVHRALARFRGEAAVETWVYKIAVNCALNFLGRQKRLKWAKQMLGQFRVIEEDAPSAAADLEKPLRTLNPRQRMILMLAEVEEKKLEEIAEMLQLPLGTVKSTLHRARETVKEEVIKNGGL